jgi:multiple sugar transport system substrate-binding protein
MRIKRLAAVALAAIVLAAPPIALTAQGAVKKTKVTIWAWPSNDQAFQAVIKGFNAKYPDIEVSWEMKTGHAQTRDALLAAFAAGEGAPDISLIELSWIGTMALNDGFVDLTKSPYNAGKYKKDIVGYKWDLATAPSGALIAFPWDIGPACIFYRRDVLDKAGVPSDPDKLAKLIKTWDDYYAVGKKVNDPANKVWWTDTAGAIPYIYYAHKNYFDKDFNIAIDNPTTRKVLALGKRIRNEGLDAKATQWTDEWYTMLSQGRVATVISGCWFGGFLKGWIAKDTAGKWGVIPIPEQPLQNWGGSFLGITKQSKNPEAAWKFIEYITTDPDATKAVLQSNDFLPSYKPDWKDPIYDQSDPFFGGQKTRRLWLDIASSEGPFVVTPLDAEAESAYNDELAKFLDQNLDIEPTIKSMVKAIDAATSADRKIVLKQLKKQ